MKSKAIIYKLLIVLVILWSNPCMFTWAQSKQLMQQDTDEKTYKIKVLKYTGEPQTDVYAKLYSNSNRFEADENGVITVKYKSRYTHSVTVYANKDAESHKLLVQFQEGKDEGSVYFESLRDIMEYKRTARLFPIEGIVVDSKGNPIENATVSIQGTGRRTLTDEIGLFQIEADFNHQVNFRADGMESKSLPLTALFKEGEVTITLNGKNSWEVYGSVERMPEFPGGMQAFQKYLKNFLIYPVQALKKKIEGVVVVQFVVETNGAITEPRIARHLEESMDSVALKLVKDMPKWTPASDFGTRVRCKYSLPVAFKLPKPVSTDTVPLIHFTGVDTLAQQRLAMRNIHRDSIGREALFLDSLAKEALKTDLSRYDECLVYKMDGDALKSLEDQASHKVKKRNVFVRFFRWLFGIERRQRNRAEGA